MSAKCPRCGKAVYFAERAMGPGWSQWHKTCFRCKTCGKTLDSMNCKEHREGTTIEVYCGACYSRAFGPKGYGYAGGGAMMHTGGGPAPTSAQSQPQPQACAKCGSALDRPSRFCPNCGAPTS